ncbi:MAG: histidine kinase [Bacteroidota bacterium]
MPEGLFKLDDSCLQLTNIDITSDWVNNRVDDAAYIQGGNILFASKGSGLVLYTPDTFLQITQSDGLLSSLIHRVFVDKNETAWTASSKGLNSVSFNGLRSIVYPKYDDELWEYKSDLQENDDREMRPTVSFRIRSFGQAHGIPNLEIRDIAESENYLWLTTGEGVLKFIPPPFDSFSRKPLIESISLNGKLVDDSYLLELPASSNHFLELNFATLNLAQLGNNHYRYRLGQDTLWREIDQNELSFPSLPRGSYVFEIQSQNPDGIWSQSVILPISVAIPWHAKGWFRLSIVSLLLGLISLFFIRRDRIRQQEFALRQQIQQLERSALQAQMNPHFVFNSLNSIQKFVIRQETKEAVDYLARFAELIRDTLKMSARGLHSLDDEVRMLRHYLDLEKLRFKDGFNYSIEQESWINAKEVMIPPMLIQPFIENAIKHGLRDKKKGGQIDIRFAGDREELRVNILDNGRGFDPRKSKKYDTRERGMDITQRRLELLQKGTYQEKPMEIKLRYNDEGEVCGTEIIIFISTIHRTLS